MLLFNHITEGIHMSTRSPEIQIWISKSKTKEQRDEIFSRSIKIEGCNVLFVGADEEGKYVVIKSMTGSAITTPATEYYGRNEFPDAPCIDMLAKFSVVSHVEINFNM